MRNSAPPARGTRGSGCHAPSTCWYHTRASFTADAGIAAPPGPLRPDGVMRHAPDDGVASHTTWKAAQAPRGTATLTVRAAPLHTGLARDQVPARAAL